VNTATVSMEQNTQVKSASTLVPRITASTLAAAVDRHLPSSAARALLHDVAAAYMLLTGYRSTEQADGRTDTVPLHRRLRHTTRPASVSLDLETAVQ